MAHLLGVVGTDVPEADLREAMSPHIVSEMCLYNINNIYTIPIYLCFSVRCE